MIITFEDYLKNNCPTSVHTKNDSVGFDNWLQNLDGDEYIAYADSFGNRRYEAGYRDGMDETKYI